MTKAEEDELLLAHDRSFKNMASLKKDQLCGCFDCLKTFRASEIKEVIPERGGGKTACCPYCGMDAVLGESSGFPITEEFLKKMNKYWLSSEK